MRRWQWNRERDRRVRRIQCTDPADVTDVGAACRIVESNRVGLRRASVARHRYGRGSGCRRERRGDHIQIAVAQSAEHQQIGLRRIRRECAVAIVFVTGDREAIDAACLSGIDDVDRSATLSIAVRAV